MLFVSMLYGQVLQSYFNILFTFFICLVDIFYTHNSFLLSFMLSLL